ncbi:MAG TPA: hypothetical protein DCM28_04815 [Phycisphaerales bacterium]|nr:hypothetical protein [Phycisphaerales bacterium]HCD33581.1 hypothetical protein [Phycisphaerales bacterium]
MSKRLIDLMQQANDPTVGQGVLRMARLAVTAHYFEQSIRHSQAEPLLRLVGGEHDQQPEPSYPIHKYQQDDQASELRRLMEDES